MKLSSVFTSTLLFTTINASVASDATPGGVKQRRAKAQKACDMKIPNMYGEYLFAGHRLEGNQKVPEVLDSWDQHMSKRAISGTEWVPWVDGSYYLLVINSPAGMVRRFCVFDVKDYRSSVCTGMDNRDETATETLYVTDLDENCNALAFSIVTTKAWTKDETEVANMFVDEVQGTRTCFGYPKTPADVEGFVCAD